MQKHLQIGVFWFHTKERYLLKINPTRSCTVPLEQCCCGAPRGGSTALSSAMQRYPALRWCQRWCQES